MFCAIYSIEGIRLNSIFKNYELLSKTVSIRHLKLIQGTRLLMIVVLVFKKPFYSHGL